ncbi:MAG: acetyltransferase [Chitinophagaceae bacterium]|nr:acetyltransferase [Chitinophagaceae bacterium]
MKTKKLVIYGLGETADLAYEYFTYDSIYEVVAFAVDKEYKTENLHLGLPVIDFELIESIYPKTDIELFVGASFTKLNRSRMKMYNAAKAKGYTCASYISSKAFIWHNAEIGENAFVLENNVIQHKVKIGNNVILWSGNHIGHQTIIEDNVTLSSHCVISGFCTIGANSFLGVNCTFNDKIKLGKDNFVGSGALIVKNTEDGKLMIGAPAKPSAISTYDFFKIPQLTISVN